MLDSVAQGKLWDPSNVSNHQYPHKRSSVVNRGNTKKAVTEISHTNLNMIFLEKTYKNGEGTFNVRLARLTLYQFMFVFFFVCLHLIMSVAFTGQN